MSGLNIKHLHPLSGTEPDDITDFPDEGYRFSEIPPAYSSSSDGTCVKNNWNKQDRKSVV